MLRPGIGVKASTCVKWRHYNVIWDISSSVNPGRTWCLRFKYLQNSIPKGHLSCCQAEPDPENLGLSTGASYTVEHHIVELSLCGSWG